jgi:two-component system chemotaxis response regulator CheB
MSEAETQKIGTPSTLACPDCGGPLWQVQNDSLVRFRCSVGHAFSAASLLESQEESVEKALWVALRTLEERARMLRRMSEDARHRGFTHGKFEADARESLAHAEQIRGLLITLNNVGGSSPGSKVS